MRILNFTAIFLLVVVFTHTVETFSQENAKTNIVTELKNVAGVQYIINDTTTQILFHGKPVETPNDCVFSLENMKDHSRILLPVQKVEQPDERTAIITGSQIIDDVKFSYSYKITLDELLPVIQIMPTWETDKDLNGYEVVFQYQATVSPERETPHQNKFLYDWRMQHYPFAGNSEKCYVTPMRYCGIPGMLLYKPDLSTVLLYTIDSRSDYCNPTTWTGTTRLEFVNQKTAPGFVVCKGQIKSGTKYELPLQIYLDDSGKFTTAIPNIIKAWMKTVDYKVEPLFVRTPQEAFDMVFEFRKNPSHWVEGKGFKHNNLASFCYPGEYPMFCIWDYRMYLKTGDNKYRERAFKQIDYLFKAQQPSGVFHTTLNLKPRKGGNAFGHNHTQPDKPYEDYCSADHLHDAYKPDINAMTARYLLAFWKMLKDNKDEVIGEERLREIYDRAVKCLDYVLAQQNEDGGFSQCVDITTGKRAISTVCGRTMVAFPYAAEITGNKKYLDAALRAEKFLRENVQNRFWYTGAHPDLPPEDFEQDSIFNVIEYWLDKYDRTKEQDALDNAIANAYYVLLYWCPKQLSWVKSPTQLAHSEQVHYNTYAVYTYNNHKVVSLDRLHKVTNNPLFLQLRDRVMQNMFFTQTLDPQWRGSISEAIADPWLEQKWAKQGFEFKGVIYPNQTLEFISELWDLGLVK
ncbi:MAG: hypothetical protein LBC74_09185 [Planctomycetaceae bacterium]|jgi:hypothetical protein|nr:hypothetical protein [Planctomycetaceae bacterium]